jgi:hypothetical protein
MARSWHGVAGAAVVSGVRTPLAQSQVATQQLAAADSGCAAEATGRLDSQSFGFTILLDSRRRCR